MTEERTLIERNIELSAEFSRYLFEHPEVEEQLPLGAEVALLPEFDEEIKTYNLSLGKKVEAEGDRVIYVSIKRLRPKALSRIEGIELQSVA